MPKKKEKRHDNNKEALQLLIRQLKAGGQQLIAVNRKLKASEEALKESERKLRGILDHTFQFIGLMTLDGILIDANRTALNFVGLEEAMVLNKPFWETGWWTHSPELQEKLRAAIKEAAEGTLVRFEATHRAKDGSLHDIDFSLSPIKNEEGKVIFLVPEGRDITEYKKMEQELIKYRDHLEELVKEREASLQESELRFKTIFNDSNDGLLLADPQTKRFLMWNKSICQMLRYSEEEIKGLGVNDIHPKNALPDAIAAFEGQARGELKFASGLAVKRKDGSIFYADINASSLILNGKKYLLGSFRDITERKIAEENLKVSEESYRAIFESANDAIVIRNIYTYEVLDANNRACGMFCYPKEEIIGSALESIITDSAQYTLKKIKQIFYDIGIGRGPQIFEWLIQDKIGRQFWAELSVKRAIIKGKYCLLSIMRDITERKHATEIKNNFMNTVSHELRTPLGIIEEGIALVLEGKVGVISEEQKNTLGMAKNSVDRLERLINQVLDFQKLDAGRMEFKFEENDINKVVKEIYQEMIALTKKKGLEFILKLDESLPRIKFDKDQIIEVVTNLVNNAIKFTEKGSVTITTSRQDNAIQVSVEDTGRGIKEEDLSKLFQRFAQLERKPGGTGLGLAISKGIIDAHKGRIWVESHFGEGAKFYFILPIMERRK